MEKDVRDYLRSLLERKKCELGKNVQAAFRDKQDTLLAVTQEMFLADNEDRIAALLRYAVSDNDTIKKSLRGAWSAHPGIRKLTELIGTMIVGSMENLDGFSKVDGRDTARLNEVMNIIRRIGRKASEDINVKILTKDDPKEVLDAIRQYEDDINALVAYDWLNALPTEILDRYGIKEGDSND